MLYATFSDIFKHCVRELIDEILKKGQWNEDEFYLQWKQLYFSLFFQLLQSAINQKVCDVNWMRQKKSVDRYVFEQKLWLQIWFCCLQISWNDAPSLYCVFWNLCDDDKCNEYHFLLRYRQAGATTVFQIYILGDQRVERWRKLLVSPWSIVIPGYRLHA